MRGIGRVAVAAAAMVSIACGQGEQTSRTGAATPTAAPTAAGPTPVPARVSGLGELMSLQQMRHAKLWWAGHAGNWKLAGYELDELREGFEDIARLHPIHKESPVPIDQAIETIMTEPLQKVGQAIASKDHRAFAGAYDVLTDGCNACHGATNFGFNVVKRPTVNTFSNQTFAPADARDR